MNPRFLGRISFAAALEAEEAAFRHGSGLLGFESEPVVTLGVRGRVEDDLTVSEEELQARGYSLFRVPRGGQATIHNPGQLVIFPVRKIDRVRPWIDLLAVVTRETLNEFGIEARWDDCKPGLYTSQGKIVSIGLKIRQGISTHGLAINIGNRIEDFAMIRACGEARMPVDRFRQFVALEAVFNAWVRHFGKHI